MSEQFETRPLVDTVNEADYFLVCLSHQNFRARPLTGRTLKGFILGEGNPTANAPIIRSASPPPDTFHGLWLETIDGQLERSWIRTPDQQHWVSAELFLTAGARVKVSANSRRYFPALALGDSLYIESCFFTTQVSRRALTADDYWQVSFQAMQGKTPKDLVTLTLNLAAIDEVIRVSSFVGRVLSATQATMFRVRFTKHRHVGDMLYCSYGLLLREVRPE